MTDLFTDDLPAFGTTEDDSFSSAAEPLTQIDATLSARHQSDEVSDVQTLVEGI